MNYNTNVLCFSLVPDENVIIFFVFETHFVHPNARKPPVMRIHWFPIIPNV